ncbi:MAG: hypothetical protein ACKVLM_00275 [Pseudomonadales bacterium]
MSELAIVTPPVPASGNTDEPQQTLPYHHGRPQAAAAVGKNPHASTTFCTLRQVRCSSLGNAFLKLIGYLTTAEGAGHMAAVAPALQTKTTTKARNL